MNKNWLIVIGILLLIVGFYWFHRRPANIIKYCHKHAEENAKIWSRTTGDDDVANIYDRSYEKCLHEKGLN